MRPPLFSINFIWIFLANLIEHLFETVLAIFGHGDLKSVHYFQQFGLISVYPDYLKSLKHWLCWKYVPKLTMALTESGIPFCLIPSHEIFPFHQVCDRSLHNLCWSDDSILDFGIFFFNFQSCSKKDLCLYSQVDSDWLTPTPLAHDWFTWSWKEQLGTKRNFAHRNRK